jgi:hypothetical protein
MFDVPPNGPGLWAVLRLGSLGSTGLNALDERTK